MNPSEGHPFNASVNRLPAPGVTQAEDLSGVLDNAFHASKTEWKKVYTRLRLHILNLKTISDEETPEMYFTHSKLHITPCG
ncbi:hypothetical protein NPIL_615081 [Nephila pilipes]|uniref:Uncharacterized protein n=1 Tax=Nephila pilipes TaxID=299642 RepID=A0A8X6Q628_NEPPI|nr:hypothetical protein NPIL_615081 [Nephila pilipes]